MGSPSPLNRRSSNHSHPPKEVAIHLPTHTYDQCTLICTLICTRACVQLHTGWSPQHRVLPPTPHHCHIDIHSLKKYRLTPDKLAKDGASRQIGGERRSGSHPLHGLLLLRRLSRRHVDLTEERSINRRDDLSLKRGLTDRVQNVSLSRVCFHSIYSVAWLFELEAGDKAALCQGCMCTRAVQLSTHHLPCPSCHTSSPTQQSWNLGQNCFGSWTGTVCP